MQKTFQSEAGSVNIENVSKVNKNGETCYVGTFDKNGMKGHVTVAEDGSLLQVLQTGNIALINQAPPLGKSDVNKSELPDAVQSALKQHAGTNQVGEIGTIHDSGQTFYTAAYNDAGVHTELVLNKDGKLLLRAEQTALMVAPLKNTQTVTMQTAPQSVQDAIRQHGGPNAQVSDIDKGQWNGQTAYRVLIRKNGSTRPVLISESGEILRGSPSSVGSAGSSQQGSGQPQSENSDRQGRANSAPTENSNSNEQ
ncbi:MAG: hypothetical protein SFY81_06560 [Verrucomicrobiota bacterium]|nr:hypothetical protein [Verrucomicrobiota bacterium]